MSRKKGKHKKYTKRQLRDAILGIFLNFPSKSLNYRQIAHQLKLRDAPTKRMIREILYDLADEESIIETARGKYRFKAQKLNYEGTVDMTAKGSAYIATEAFDEDVFIRQPHLNRALHGDLVKFYVYPRRKDRKPEGEVLEIVQRNKTKFVGQVEILKNFAFLITKDKKMPFDIFIPLPLLEDAENGDLAIAEITDWPKKSKNPMGRIIDVLGKPGNNDTEMHAILAEFGLPYKFPEEVEHFAQKISPRIPQREIARRKDFRDTITFTIDPKDAKDFDDALSLKKLSNGNWEAGVHIADVSHYVKKGDIVDKEAYERATSVYLVDRTIPMLPEKLSNNLCSLRPNEEKLCFSAVFEMNSKAQVVKYWLGRTIICSDKRFTYEEAQEIIESGKGELNTEIAVLNDFAKKLRMKRFAKGSIDFHRSEIKFNIDENGKPLSVYYKESKEANQLIEEFMLLANRTVAKHITQMKDKQKKVFVYRVHDVPDPQKLNDFNLFVKKFGYKVSDPSPQNFTKAINGLLKQIKGKSEENLIETLAIRSMAKAVYTTKNIGHYGLGFDYYSHFTSPIRRYPDLMVHRLLFDYLNKGKSKNKEEYEKKCKHSSDMELLAANAERSSIKYKQVEFMLDKVGGTFEGTISGVTGWGIFVELTENKCEGLVRISNMEDDYYTFDEKNYCIVGKYHGKKYQLGDKITIKVVKADLAEKQLDFELG